MLTNNYSLLITVSIVTSKILERRNEIITILLILIRLRDLCFKLLK